MNEFKFALITGMLVLGSGSTVARAQSPDEVRNQKMIELGNSTRELRETVMPMDSTSAPDQRHTLELARKVFPKEFKGMDYDRAYARAIQKWPKKVVIDYEAASIIDYQKLTATPAFQKFAKAHPTEVSAEAMYSLEQLAERTESMQKHQQKVNQLRTTIASLNQEYEALTTRVSVDPAKRLPASP